MVRRHELTDQAWAEIAPLLPAGGRPGGQWADHRRVVNGILWKLATGVPWRDVPERYGPWQTSSERFRRWQAGRHLAATPGHAQTRSDAVGDVDWGGRGRRPVVWAHQHARRRPKRGPGDYLGSAAEADQALGGSRGGLTTKSTWPPMATVGRWPCW